MKCSLILSEFSPIKIEKMWNTTAHREKIKIQTPRIIICSPIGCFLYVGAKDNGHTYPDLEFVADIKKWGPRPHS